MQLWSKSHGPRRGDLPALIATRQENGAETTAFEQDSKRRRVQGDAAMRTSRLIASRAHLNARAEQQLRAFRGAASPWICLSAVLSASALADQAPHPRTVPVDRTLEEIVVTGTRLRISSIDATLPVTVLSRRDIERGGADSIGKILQTLPAITGSQLNTNVNAGGGMEPSPSGGGSGDGSVRASLRGGSLVLLNGRRFPNGGIGADTAVDLNTIPVSLIERVELHEIFWSGFMLGSLLVCRAGVSVRGGQNYINKEIAETSTMYFTFRRRNRPVDDLSHGWGSNSQWRTKFRRDYTDECNFYYNVDAGIHANRHPIEDFPHTSARDLSGKEKIELLVNRCFIVSEIPPGPLWPYDETFSEKLSSFD